MFNKHKISRIFVLQSDDAIGKLSQRSKAEGLECTISNQPFYRSLSNTRQMGTIISKKRLLTGFFVFISIFGLFIGRTVYIQLIKGAEYKALAESNRYNIERIIPQRGIIYDRNGIVLAENIPSFILTMTTANLPKEDEERSRVMKRVSALSGVQPTEIDLLLTKYAKTPFESVPVKRNIPFERAMQLAIETKQLPGFNLETINLRQYPS